MKEIIVTAYPRSGQTWLIHMLCDLLDSPQQDTPDSELMWWGDGREGGYVIRKTHLPYSDDLKDKTVVYLQRDPRDVAVSASHYLGIGLIEAVAEMELMMPYKEFCEGWLGKDFEVMRYEYLDNPYWLESLFGRMGWWQLGMDFGAVLEHHSLPNMQRQLGSHFCRKGIVGDWRNHFTRETAKEFDELLGDFMLEQGYIESRDWWKEL